MINIRKHTFETNSSSSHTISLSKPTPPVHDDIPKNTTFKVEPYDSPLANGHEDYTEVFVYRTQVAKLRYLVHVIVSVLYEDVPKKYLTEFAEQLNDWRYRETSEDKEKYADSFYAIDQFRWLKDAVYEETGTTIEIERNTDSSFPFWETVYDEDSSLLTVFDFTSQSWNDETLFKANVKNIIFNDDIVIHDKSIPYGYSEDLKVYDY